MLLNVILTVIIEFWGIYTIRIVSTKEKDLLQKQSGKYVLRVVKLFRKDIIVFACFFLWAPLLIDPFKKNYKYFLYLMIISSTFFILFLIFSSWKLVLTKDYLIYRNFFGIVKKYKIETISFDFSPLKRDWFVKSGNKKVCKINFFVSDIAFDEFKRIFYKEFK